MPTRHGRAGLPGRLWPPTRDVPRAHGRARCGHRACMARGCSVRVRHGCGCATFTRASCGCGLRGIPCHGSPPLGRSDGAAGLRCRACARCSRNRRTCRSCGGSAGAGRGACRSRARGVPERDAGRRARSADARWGETHGWRHAGDRRAGCGRVVQAAGGAGVSATFFDDSCMYRGFWLAGNSACPKKGQIGIFTRRICARSMSKIGENVPLRFERGRETRELRRAVVGCGARLVRGARAGYTLRGCDRDEGAPCGRGRGHRAGAACETRAVRRVLMQSRRFEFEFERLYW